MPNLNKVFIAHSVANGHRIVNTNIDKKPRATTICLNAVLVVGLLLFN
jgi:hypothetical protein